MTFIAIVLSLVVFAEPASATASGRYRVKREATVRFNPKGFFVGTISAGSRVYYSGGSSDKGFIAVYSEDFGRCVWLLQSKLWDLDAGKPKRGTETKVGKQSGPTCNPPRQSGTSSRNGLLSRYAADINDIRDGRYQEAYAVGWGCYVYLERKVPIYGRLLTLPSGKVDPKSKKVDRTTNEPLMVQNVAWRYTVKGRPSTVVVFAQGEWGYIEIAPGQALPHTVHNSSLDDLIAKKKRGERLTEEEKNRIKFQGRCRNAGERTIGTADQPIRVP